MKKTLVNIMLAHRLGKLPEFLADNFARVGGLPNIIKTDDQLRLERINRHWWVWATLIGLIISILLVVVLAIFSFNIRTIVVIGSIMIVALALMGQTVEHSVDQNKEKIVSAYVALAEEFLVIHRFLVDGEISCPDTPEMMALAIEAVQKSILSETRDGIASGDWGKTVEKLDSYYHAKALSRMFGFLTTNEVDLEFSFDQEVGQECIQAVG